MQIHGGYHKIICNKKDKNFFVIIGNLSIECSGNYEEITVEGYFGSLICPDYNRVCSGSVWCNDPLTCIEKESIYEDDDTLVREVMSKIYLNDENCDKFIFVNFISFWLFFFF